MNFEKIIYYFRFLQHCRRTDKTPETEATKYFYHFSGPFDSVAGLMSFHNKVSRNLKTLENIFRG